MKRDAPYLLAPLIAVGLVLGACGEPADPTDARAGPGAADYNAAPAASGGEEGAPAGKPTAPIDIRYNVIGAAFVGQPVNIEIDVSSTVRDRSIALEYRINDPRDLSFAEAQPQRVALSAIGDAPSAKRQVTVVPQREGRLYLNVSAEIETGDGVLMKAMAIPVQVGSARPEAASNGARKEDGNGDAVMSMPAEENSEEN